MPRTMKDKERFMIIVKTFLDLNGPATAKEISDYVNERNPVKLLMIVSPRVVSSLLRSRRGIIKVKENREPIKYCLEEK